MFHEWSLLFHSCWLEHSMENWLCFIRPNLFSLKCGIYPKGSVLTPSSPKLQTNEVLHQTRWDYSAGVPPLRPTSWTGSVISSFQPPLTTYRCDNMLTPLTAKPKFAPSDKRPFELYIATRSHALIHILYTHYAVLCYVYLICNIICSKVIK